MSEIVLFRNHEDTAGVKLCYNQLIQSSREIVELYDCTGRKAKDKAFNTSFEDYLKLGYPLASDEQISKSIQRSKKNYHDIRHMHNWYNAGYSVLNYFQNNPEYDYYWSIESDVFFYGDWDILFDTFKNDDTDFIGPSIKLANNNTPIPIPFIEERFPFEEKIFSYGIIHRYSNRLLEQIHELLIQGIHAYYELLFPTIANAYNMTIKGLNDNGIEFYRLENITEKKIDAYKIIHTNGAKNHLFHRVI